MRDSTSTSTKVTLMKIFAKLISIIAVLSLQSALAAPDPAKVKGPDECGECHKEEIKVWKTTHHSETFNKMARTNEAKEIAKKMDIRRIKSESECLNCHFTSVPKGDKITPIAGVSCESCHTPAKEWMDIHNDYGGKNVKREGETAAHKQERLAKIKKLGMIGHNDIYALASNCFQCHTVPNEKLVNVGGHEAGSKFELVSWSQGEVRHNFMRSSSGKENVESDQPRKRVFYVVGRGVDLEYSLRGMAAATTAGKYADKMAERVKAAVAELEKINKTKAIPEVASMIATGKAAKLAPNNKAALLKDADAVGAQAKAFASSNDGKGIAAIDALITAKYKK